MVSVSRSPTTMSARPSTIGSTSLGMSWPEYWLSASVLTMTSAPSFSAASRPAWKPAARPLLLVRRTMWSTPFSRATSIVRSVDPSSMISHSTTSKPGTSRGRSASVAGSVASSLRHGIWMMSFMRGRAGATGRAERSTPYTRWRPVSHMASATITRPAPGPDPAAGRRSRRWSWPCWRSSRSRWARWSGSCLPDLSQLRQLLLAAVGPRAAARRQAVLRRLPHADRASAGRRLRGAALAPRRSGATGHGRRHAGVVRRARRRPLPPGARRRSGRSSGWRPAALLCTRFDFPFLAARAYIDIPYLAFVVWAAALEAERPRRGTVGLRAAGLRGAHAPGGVAAQRPVLAVVRPRPPSWPQRVALLRAHRRSPPVIWTALDWWATGDPKFSLTHTSGLAEELGRTSGGLSDVPSTTVKFLKNLDKVPVFYAGDPRRRHRGAAHAAARAHAAGAAGHRPGHLRARRPRRAVGHRPLPARALAAWSWSSPASRSAAGRCCARGARARSGRVGVGGAHHLRRGLHGHPGQLLDLHQRADLPRRLARVAARRCSTTPRSAPGCAAARCRRPTTSSSPTSRWLLDAPAEQGHRPQRRAASARGSGAAWRSTRSTACRCCARASPSATSRPRTPSTRSRWPGFTRVAFTPYYSAYVRC